MFYQPELFVYLMLLPVVCLVALPAFFSTTRTVIGLVQKNKLAQKNHKAVEQNQIFDQEALADA